MKTTFPSTKPVSKGKSVFFHKVLVSFSTMAMLFSFNVFKPLQAQTVNDNSSDLVFSGNSDNPNKVGGEYLVYKLQGNTAQGLLYVQNSDVFSCFQGTYDNSKNSVNEVIFAYPEADNGEWVKNQSNESLSLKDFPHDLTGNNMSEGSSKLFEECLKLF